MAEPEPSPLAEHAAVLLRFWPMITALFFAGMWAVRQTVTTPKAQIRQLQGDVAALQSNVTALREDIDEVRVAQSHLADRIDRVLELLTHPTHHAHRRHTDPEE